MVSTTAENIRPEVVETEILIFFRASVHVSFLHEYTLRTSPPHLLFSVSCVTCPLFIRLRTNKEIVLPIET